jgi:hypothetical protein
MLQFVTDAQEIKKLNGLFFGQLNKQADSKTQIRLGYRGAKQNVPVMAGYNDQLKFWWTNEEVIDHGEPAYWNAFNLSPTDLIANRKYNSRVNISYYKSGDSMERSSRFAIDANRNYYLLHSGSLRGGKEGLTKEFFWEYYTGEYVLIRHGKKESKFALVAALNSDSIVGDVYSFILQVDRIKKIKAGEITVDSAETAIKGLTTSEYWGDKSYDLPERHIEYTSDHGYIIDCLIKVLKEKGHIAGRTKLIDVFIQKGETFSHIFELKTKLSTQTLYTAIGQLMLHSLTADKHHKKIFVMPSGQNPEVHTDLRKLDIDVLTFTKDGLKVTFHNLDTIL